MLTTNDNADRARVGAGDAAQASDAVQVNHTGIVARWHLLGAACCDARMSRANCAVLFNILGRMNDAGDAWPSVRRIAADTGADKRTVTRAIKVLVELGYLIRQSGNRKDPNVYRMGRGEPAHTVGASLPLGASLPVGANLSQGYGRTCPQGRGEPAHVTCPVNLSSELVQKRRAKRAALCLPDWLPLESWSAWKRHRGRKLTEEAQRRGIAKLEKLREEGHDAKELIERAIESGWASFYPRKDGGKNNPVGNVNRDTRTESEIEAANMAALESLRVGGRHG